MKITDILPNIVIVLSIAIFSSYVTYHYFDYGLLVSLPDGITRLFLDNPAIQYVALATLVAGIVGKIVIERASKRQVRAQG